MGLAEATVPELVALPGLVHGFGRRAGTGEETRQATRERACRAREPARVLFLQQVHGSAVLEAPWEGTPEGDAGVCSEPGFLLGIETADCLPVLMVDPVGRAVAAAHAGWRGTAASIVARTVDALVGRGSRVADLKVALGPGIGPCCYEVGDDLRAALGPGAEPFFRRGSNGGRGRPHLDVRGLNVRQLRERGVPAHQIHSVDECTSCRPDLYYSYRRDGPATGRMISVVGFGAEGEE